MCYFMYYKVKKHEQRTHHFLGMLLTQWRLVCDVKDRDRTLRPVRETCSAAREQLLGPVLQDIYTTPSRTQPASTTKSYAAKTLTKIQIQWCTLGLTSRHDHFQRIRLKQCLVKGRQWLVQASPLMLAAHSPESEPPVHDPAVLSSRTCNMLLHI